MYFLLTSVLLYVILYLSTSFFSQSRNENRIICESPSRQTCMNDLPQELFIEVLLRLPVKSLLRFKVVCRAWQSQISDRKFIKRHNVRTTTNPSNDYFIAHNKSPSNHEKLCAVNINSLHRAISLNLPNNGENFNVVGSCNGLLCLDYKRGMQSYYRVQSLTKKLYLRNPATRKVKDIPRYNINIENPDDYHVSLGFGFDLADSDYKIVRIVREEDSSTNRVEVYSLNKNSWKEIKVELEFKVYQSIFPVFVRGILYWDIKYWDIKDWDIRIRNWDIRIRNWDIKQRALLSFNVQSEKFCKILLPPPDTLCDDLFEFNGCVAFAHDVYGRNTINIWTLEDDSSWIIKLTIENPPIRISNVVGYLKTGEFVGRISDELVVYDPLSEAKKPIQPRMHTLRTYNYSESLVNFT